MTRAAAIYTSVRPRRWRVVCPEAMEQVGVKGRAFHHITGRFSLSLPLCGPQRLG